MPQNAKPRLRSWLWTAAIAVLVLLAWWKLRSGSLESGSGSANPAVPAEMSSLPAPAGSDPVFEGRSYSMVFEGRVVSATTGRGVEGAELTFSRSGEANQVVASPEGRFRFEPQLTGRWQLAIVSARGYLPFAPEWGRSPVILDAYPGAAVGGLLITLYPEVQYLGRVIGPGGEPVSGATIKLLTAATGQTALMPIPDLFTSDATGEFNFVAPDEAVLEARHPSFVPVRAHVDLTVRMSRQLVLTFRERTKHNQSRESLVIRGVVLTIGDRPVGGALVEVWPEETDRFGVSQTMTFTDGRFELAGLEPGNYRVIASAPHLAPAVSRDVPAGTSDLQLSLWVGGHVAGHVRQKGNRQPVESFTITVQPRGQGWWAKRTLSVVDPQGAFDLDGLFPGSSSLTVTAPGYAPLDEVPLIVPAPYQPPLELELELSVGSRLQGRVIERGSRRPLLGATLEVEALPDTTGSTIPAGISAITGSEGSFDLISVPERAFSLRVFASGHHGRVVAVPEFSASVPREPLTIELEPRGEIEPPRLDLVDIGAELTRRGDVLSIESVIDGGGAREAGLEPGDLVISIDGRSVTGLSRIEVSSLLRGLENSAVTLAIRKLDEPSDTNRLITVYRRARPAAAEPE